METGAIDMIDDATITETKKYPTTDELFASGRIYMSLSPDNAVRAYIYLDGNCVGTMWVELTQETGCGFFETCFDGYHKWPDRLEEVVGPGNWGHAEDALAKHIVEEVTHFPYEPENSND
jgi:hypothetical protein